MISTADLCRSAFNFASEAGQGIQDPLPVRLVDYPTIQDHDATFVRLVANESADVLGEQSDG